MYNIFKFFNLTKNNEKIFIITKYKNKNVNITGQTSMHIEKME